MLKFVEEDKEAKTMGSKWDTEEQGGAASGVCVPEGGP